jgi:tetratricopeptide (TPR) repeat protein
VTAPKVSADALIPFELLTTGKIDQALEAYRQIKKTQPDNAAIAEARLNGLGYGLVRAKKLPEAIAYFKLNAEFYPQSWNVYDSLGDAYMANGDKELAIANFKKAVEMNPKNTHGIEMLKKLAEQ